MKQSEKELDTPFVLQGANDKSDVEHLLEEIGQGIDIHSDDDYLLALCVSGNDPEMVKILLEHGADVHSRDGYAIVTAKERGYTEISALIEEHIKNIPLFDDAPRP